MRYLIAASLLMILPAGTAAAQPYATPGECDVKVTFGSYAMGIDQPAFERIDRLLSRDGRVGSSERQRWGREGEITICAKARRRSDVAALFYRVKALFPRKPRGPLTVEAGARKFSAGRAPR